MMIMLNNDVVCVVLFCILIQMQDQLKMLCVVIKLMLIKGVVVGLFFMFVIDDNIWVLLLKVVGKSYGKFLKNGDVDSIFIFIFGFNDVNEMYDFYLFVILFLVYEFIYEYCYGIDVFCYYVLEMVGVFNYLDLMLDGFEFELWRMDENFDWNCSYDVGVMFYMVLKELKLLFGDFIYEDDIRVMLVIRLDNIFQKLIVLGEFMVVLEKIDDWMFLLIEIL